MPQRRPGNPRVTGGSPQRACSLLGVKPRPVPCHRARSSSRSCSRCSTCRRCLLGVVAAGHSCMRWLPSHAAGLRRFNGRLALRSARVLLLRRARPVALTNIGGARHRPISSGDGSRAASSRCGWWPATGGGPGPGALRALRSRRRARRRAVLRRRGRGERRGGLGCVL